MLIRYNDYVNKKIAKIISRVFEPMVVLIIMVVLGGFHAGLTGTGLTNYFLFIFLFALLPAIVFRLWYHYKKGVDWDIRDRKKRIVPLLVQIVFLILGLTVIATWGNALLTHFYLVLLIWLVGFFLVTLKWKISGHTSTLVLGIGLIISWYGWGFWPLLLTVPLVGWARINTRDHSLSQVVAGTAYSLLLLLFV